MGKYIDNYAFGKHPMEALCNPHCGVVSFLIEMSNELSQPDVFITIAKSADIEAYGYAYPYYSNGSGAALTVSQAIYAAIGETMERYCLAIIHPEDLVLSTFQDLVKNGLPAIGPSEWSLFSKEQDVSPFVKFEDDTLIAWKRADSLVHRMTKYVPATLVHLPYYCNLFEDKREQNISVSVSTGAACAKTMHEAIFKGICELVERDAFMITWKNQLACPKVHIDERSGIYNTFKKHFDRPGIEFNIYYTTLDLGIPSFWGILSGMSANGDYKWHIVGGAAHPDPEVAALKTLIELSQGLAWREYKGEITFQPTEDFSNIETFESRMELYSYNDMTEAFAFLPTEPSINLSEIKPSHGYKGDNIKETLQNIIRDFGNKDFDILAVDMTTPEAYASGLQVAKVLIPALEVMDGNYRYQYLGGKRWRSVPAHVGLKKKNPDVVLNPFPHPYP